MGGGTGSAAKALTDAFLSAPFETNGWDAALKLLASATHSGHAQLIAFGGPQTIPLNLVTDPEPGLVEEFPLIGGGSPDVNWRVASSGRPLEVKWETHYDAAKRRLKSEIYDEFVDRFDLPFGCQSVLLETADVFYGLATLRSTSDGRTSAANRELFRKTAPSVLTAIKLQEALERQGANFVAGTIEAMGGSVFVLDRSGRVQAMTAAAESKLRGDSGLRVARGKLSASNPHDDRLLQGAIYSVLGDKPRPTSSGPFWLRGRRDELPTHRCEVYPLPHREWSFGFEARAILSVLSLRELGDEGKEHMKMLLRLTGSEAEVATMIANGSSRKEIATLRGTSEGTVGSQLKAIFQKAGVEREAELVALLHRLLR